MIFTITIIAIISSIALIFFRNLPSERIDSDSSKKYSKFLPTQSEIYAVKKEIETNGFWQESYEWKLSTETYCKIETMLKNGEQYYLTTVKCETEIKIPAKNIERAIHFKKIYESLQQELYYEVGWAGWESKNKL